MKRSKAEKSEMSEISEMLGQIIKRFQFRLFVFALYAKTKSRRTLNRTFSPLSSVIKCPCFKTEIDTQWKRRSEIASEIFLRLFAYSKAYR